MGRILALLSGMQAFVLLCFLLAAPSALADMASLAATASHSAATAAKIAVAHGAEYADKAKGHKKTAETLRAKAAAIENENPEQAARLLAEAKTEKDLHDREEAAAVRELLQGKRNEIAARQAETVTKAETDKGAPATRTAAGGRASIDHDAGPQLSVQVCVGPECRPGGSGRVDPIAKYDPDTYRSLGARVQLPDTLKELKANIASTPDHITQVALDNHGGSDGTTVMSGIGRYPRGSPEMDSVYSAVRDLNADRAVRGVPPVELVLMQCYGAVCAQRAADISGTSVRAGDTPMSIPRDASELSVTTRGGSVRTYDPGGAQGTELVNTAAATISPGQGTAALAANSVPAASSETFGQVSTFYPSTNATNNSGSSGNTSNALLAGLLQQQQQQQNQNSQKKAETKEEPKADDSRSAVPQPGAVPVFTLPTAPKEVQVVDLRIYRGAVRH